MADETNIITPAAEAPTTNRAEERITELSHNLKVTAEERDAEKAKREDAERRASFAEGFVDVLATNLVAKDYKSQIQEKFSRGYSMEDATYAVLGKEGKLGAPATPVQQVAGGSATTTITQSGAKSIHEMTSAERRAALEEALG